MKFLTSVLVTSVTREAEELDSSESAPETDIGPERGSSVRDDADSILTERFYWVSCCKSKMKEPENFVSGSGKLTQVGN